MAIVVNLYRRPKLLNNEFGMAARGQTPLGL